MTDCSTGGVGVPAPAECLSLPETRSGPNARAVTRIVGAVLGQDITIRWTMDAGTDGGLFSGKATS